jgi:hypothetical protein
MSAKCINLASSNRTSFATVDRNAVRKTATTHTAKRWQQFKSSNLKIIALIFFYFFYFQLYGQINLDWTSRYNGLGNWIDQGGDITVDDNGNVYVTCSSFQNSPTNSYYIATIKYNSEGIQKWTTIWTEQPGEPNSIIVDSNGDIYVAGSISYNHIVIIKYDSLGNELWSTTYSDNSFYHLFIKMKRSSTRDLIISATTFYYTSDNSLLFLKYDENGSLLWEKSFGEEDRSDDYVFDFVTDEIDNIYFTGITNYFYNEINYTYDGGDILFLKYISSGTLLWNHSYATNYYEDGVSIDIDNRSNIYLTGRQENDFNREVITAKFNSSGENIWVKLFSNPSTVFNTGNFLKVGKHEKIYVLGYSDTTNRGNLLNLVYSSTGELQWSRNYFTPRYETASIPSGMVVDECGNVYSCGFSHDLIGRNDLYIKAYDSSGNDLFEQIYNSTGNASESGINIAIDNHSSLYFEIEDYPNTNQNEDILVLKYSNKLCESQGITLDTIQSDSICQKLFPNPLITSSSLHFNNKDHQEIGIDFYDLRGNLIKHFHTNQTEIEIERKDFVVGLYLYRVYISDKVIDFGKLIVE